MQTQISSQYLNRPEGQEANTILRSCVHCGFCTATCPTYQLLGDELDGPRGRIYLIKQVLEGQAVSRATLSHLDRCLTCRSCETTCPSGVRYGRLLDIGREIVEHQVPRGRLSRLPRYLLRKLVPYPRRIKPLLRLAQTIRPVLPAGLRRKIPARQTPKAYSSSQHSRRMLVLGGCVQSLATPATNIAAARVLNKLGVQLLEAANVECCGAVSHHLSAHEESLQFMRRNIDAWWPHIAQGVEAVVVSASGCAAVVKDYGELLKHDPGYADKARRVSELAKDLSEILRDETVAWDKCQAPEIKVAFHSPCTLQHGQKLKGVVENLLTQAGYRLTAVQNAYLCCGSAGTYSILQPQLSQRLLRDKINALQQDQPDVIATTNIGCQLHLATTASTPVKHWIELLDEALGD